MNLTFKTLYSDPAHFIALGFGAGLVPKLPGTAGSLLAVLIYWPLSKLSLPIYLTTIVLIIIIGTWAAHRSARLLGTADPSAIVIDEIAGTLVALIMLPDGWIWIAVGFLLFRFFDIVKPWPIYLLDRHIHGGIGIMADDLLAGIYSLVVLQILAVLTNASLIAL